MSFLTLTQIDGAGPAAQRYPVWVRPEHICAVRGGGNTTLLILTNGTQIRVTEPSLDILEKLGVPRPT